MTIAASFITLKGLRFYAYHGVMEQERRVGGWFVVDIRVGLPLATAVASDEVTDTLNYAALYETVRREMEKPSKLLENVAGRIAAAVMKDFPVVEKIDISVTKENPPMGADLAGAGVELHINK